MNKFQEQQVNIAREKHKELINYLHSTSFSIIEDFVVLDEMYDILIRRKNNNLRNLW